MDPSPSSRGTLPSYLQIHSLCNPSVAAHSPPASPSLLPPPSLSAMLSSPPPTPTSTEQDHPPCHVASEQRPAVMSIPSTSSGRKQFIQAYARMAPYLRPTHSCLWGKRHDLSQIGSALLRHQHPNDDSHHHQDKRNSSRLIAPPSPPYTTLVLDPSARRRSRSLSCDSNRRYHDDPPKKSSSTGSNSISRDMSHKNIPPSPFVSLKKKAVGQAPIRTTAAKASTRRTSCNSHRAAGGVGNSSSGGGGELRIKGLTLDPAYTFDTLDIDSDDHVFFPSDWVPNPASLDQVPVDVSWKGQPMPPDENQPYLDRLHRQEVKIVSHMRMTPAVYLRCKRAIIMAAREFSLHHQEFRKSDAQKVCRIDVNKSSRLWALFHEYKWLSPHSQH